MNKKIKRNCAIISLIVSILIYFFIGIFITDKQAMLFTSIACFLALLFITESVYYIYIRKNLAENIYTVTLSSILLFDVIIFTINTFSNNFFILYPFLLSLIIMFILLFFKDGIYKLLNSIFNS